MGRPVSPLRGGYGWSQERRAEVASRNRTYLGDVERGERNLSLVNIHRLARALGIDLAALMIAVEAVRRRSRQGSLS